jgi:uncharacterized lipoprotein YddW (UPF0748 family)
MKNILLVLLALCFLTDSLLASDLPPKREMRAAWVATVANIDWPSSRYASSGEQISELVNMFDKLHAAGINAIMFQVRTECDALYESSIEPWSYWLTGKQGKSPDPFFDPLAFAVAEAHNRGMELHAWFNPYRAVKNEGEYEVSAEHVTQKHPDWILTFGKYKMLDPGMHEVKDFIASVVSDVVRRYDIDGVHFDDYFYPYSPKVSTEDLHTYEKYKDNFPDIHDWRRNNINSMVAQVYDSINAIRPAVKFGISPFGIVQNKYAGTDGFNSYDILYCDPLTWIKDKTVDYVTPQIYWEIGKKVADYEVLLPWWASVTGDRHLYIGHFSSRFAAKNWTGNKAEMGDQIRMNRVTPNVLGSVFFSAKSISNNYSGFADTLRNSFYKYPAFPPIFDWKDTASPKAPINLNAFGDSTGILLRWEKPAEEESTNKIRYYAIYRFETGEPDDISDVRKIIKMVRSNRHVFKDYIQLEDQKEFTYVVTSLDRLYNESPPDAVFHFTPVGR